MAFEYTEKEKSDGVEGKFYNWMITCNNWTQETHDSIPKLSNCKYLFQHEIGKQGTPHIQGVLMFKSQRTWAQLRKSIGKYWFRPAENIHACKNYCKKQKTRVGKKYFTNIPEYMKMQLDDPMEGLTPYWWQQKILDICKEKPDVRSIHWFWEPKGCEGKTTIAKHICIHNNEASLIGGKAADMKFAISELVAASKPPKILFMNITRSIEDYVSYDGIESAKDGFFFSPKFKSGMVMYNCPHIIIFANFEPQYEKLSEDRWKIYNIHEPPPASPTPTASPSPPEGAKSEATKRKRDLRLPVYKDGAWH